jgi:uncharacterized protein YjbJ (UPF0337 family)
MATMEMRGFQRQVLGKLREYEGHLKRLEGHLLVLRGRAERTTGEVQVKLGQMLADVEREAEGVRAAGRAALEGLERAVAAGQAFMDQVKGRLAEVEALAPTVVARSREVVRRATIEAKALRHGVRVGLRVARRVSKRAKAGKSDLKTPASCSSLCFIPSDPGQVSSGRRPGLGPAGLLSPGTGSASRQVRWLCLPRRHPLR